jgi:hypothetical protein
VVYGKGTIEPSSAVLVRFVDVGGVQPATPAS